VERVQVAREQADHLALKNASVPRELEVESSGVLWNVGRRDARLQHA
jgi:hypothetical protein